LSPLRLALRTYSISGVATEPVVSENYARALGTARNVALRGYAGQVNLAKITATSEATSYSVSCEVKDPGTGTPDAPSYIPTASAMTCAANQEFVGK
jgi:hypothetical protein